MNKLHRMWQNVCHFFIHRIPHASSQINKTQSDLMCFLWYHFSPCRPLLQCEKKKNYISPRYSIRFEANSHIHSMRKTVDSVESGQLILHSPNSIPCMCRFSLTTILRNAKIHGTRCNSDTENQHKYMSSNRWWCDQGSKIEV